MAKEKISSYCILILYLETFNCDSIFIKKVRITRAFIPANKKLFIPLSTKHTILFTLPYISCDKRPFGRMYSYFSGRVINKLFRLTCQCLLRQLQLHFEGMCLGRGIAVLSWSFLLREHGCCSRYNQSPQPGDLGLQPFIFQPQPTNRGRGFRIVRWRRY